MERSRPDHSSLSTVSLCPKEKPVRDREGTAGFATTLHAQWATVVLHNRSNSWYLDKLDIAVSPVSRYLHCSRHFITRLVISQFLETRSVVPLHSFMQSTPAGLISQFLYLAFPCLQEPPLYHQSGLYFSIKPGSFSLRPFILWLIKSCCFTMQLKNI